MTYSNDQKALIMLSATDGYNARKKRFESVDRPCELYDDYTVADNMIAKMEKSGIKVLTIIDEDYPKTLKEIYDPPYTLYYQGDRSLFNSNDLLAVVGTRRVSVYGKNIMQNFATAFIKSGFKIISGLARGVDSIGHRISLENDSPTVAVVANGLDICYPPENADMQKRIAESQRGGRTHSQRYRRRAKIHKTAAKIYRRIVYQGYGRKRNRQTVHF